MLNLSITFSWLLKIFIGYVFLTLLVYYFSNKLIFLPPKPTYIDHSAITRLKVGSESIATYFLKQPNARHTILFSHGNAEDLGMIAPFIERLYQMGFSVLAYDYRGYGRSEGRPSESNTYKDIRAAYTFLRDEQGIDANDIIVFGRSLGTGPSLHLAAHQPVGGLILETPYLTTFRVITRIPLFVVDKFRNNKNIKAVTAPILIIHGTEDEVIPYTHGRALAKLAPAAQFLTIEGGQHNNLAIVDDVNYWQNINRFIKNIHKND